MSLDERLERARDDYRSLAVSDRAELVVPLHAPTPPGGRPWLVAAAVVVVAGLVGAVVARAGDADGGRTQTEQPQTEQSQTEQPPAPTTSRGEPTTERLTVVLLDDEGPYADGQEVVVRVPAEIGADLAAADGIALCVAVTQGAGSEERTDSACAPRPDANLVVPGTATTTSATVVLRRTVTTVLGTVDCAAERVACRLEVPTADGDRRRSAVLVFVPDPPPAPQVEMVTSSAGEPGAFQLRLWGLAPDPSWLALRDEHPERTEGPDGFPAFFVDQCARSESLGGTEGPFGEDLWDQGRAGFEVSMCSSRPLGIALDPDAADQDLTVTLPTLVHGYAGWADCRVDQCYLEVRRTNVTSVSPDGPMTGGDISVGRVLLPTGGPWLEAVRPTLTVDTPGPHRPGQVVNVTVAGLPAGETTIIGHCRVELPDGCAVDLTPVGNGTHQVPLTGLDGCGPEECFLTLDPQAQGAPPLATAPLDTPG